VIERLAQPQSDLSEREWFRASDPPLATIAAVSRVALEFTEAHAKKVRGHAVRNLYVAVAMMIISIGLALFPSFYVMRRVIRPLMVITQSMRIVVDGTRTAAPSD
jgi:hypothetical protein